MEIKDSMVVVLSLGHLWRYFLLNIVVILTFNDGSEYLRHCSHTLTVLFYKIAPCKLLLRNVEAGERCWLICLLLLRPVVYLYLHFLFRRRLTVWTHCHFYDACVIFVILYHQRMLGNTVRVVHLAFSAGFTPFQGRHSLMVLLDVLLLQLELLVGIIVAVSVIARVGFVTGEAVSIFGSGRRRGRT